MNRQGVSQKTETEQQFNQKEQTMTGPTQLPLRRHLGLIGITLAIVALAAFSAIQRGVGVASAQSVPVVACSGDAGPLADCTITLPSDVGAGGSFTLTLASPSAVFLGCNSLSGTASCSTISTAATFSCASDCASGSTYRDVVQLSAGLASDQSLSASDAASGGTSFNAASLPSIAAVATDPPVCTATFTTDMGEQTVDAPCSSGGPAASPSIAPASQSNGGASFNAASLTLNSPATTTPDAPSCVASFTSDSSLGTVAVGC